MTQSSDLERLSKVLGYTFNKSDFLKTALTHRSASSNNNERLEFLGDSVLNFVIAEEVYTSYPDLPEGDLSRLRACLVNKEGLAKIAHDLDIGQYLLLGSGELKSGGYRRDSILADTIEAIFGAVYLDGGFDVCNQLIISLYKTQLKNIPDPSLLKDPKTRLQELLQSSKFSLPNYNLVGVNGKSHQQIFDIDCVIDELSIQSSGQGSSRRKAEQKAAEMAIAVVEEKIKSFVRK